MKTLFTLFLSLSILSFSFSQKTWDGSTGNWSDASKWIPSGVPANTDSVIVNGGTITMDITDSIQILNMSAGTLSGEMVSFNISSNFYFSGGTFSNHQKTEVGGDLTWSGGILGTLDSNTDSIIICGQTLAIPGSSKTTYSRLYSNGGGSWLSDGTGVGNINLKSSWWFWNPGAEFNINHSVNTELYMNGGGSAIYGYTNIYKSGAGNTNIKSWFIMTDSLFIEEGKFQLNGQGGTMSGFIQNNVHEGLQFLSTVYSGIYKFNYLEIKDSSILIDNGQIQIDSSSTVPKIKMLGSNSDIYVYDSLIINGDVDGRKNNGEC